MAVPQGSAAQQAAALLPDGVHVVSALHTVSAPRLADLDHELDEDVPIAGHTARANTRSPS
jgi:predicted dinucleotide-binding enzyme